MSFDEPEPLIDSSRDFGKEVGSIRIIQVVRLGDGTPSLVTKGREGGDNTADVRCALGDGQRILIKLRADGCNAHSSFCDAAELDNAFSDQIDIRLDGLGNFIEQLVKANEVRALDVPMRLLHLHLQVDGRRQSLVHDGVQLQSLAFGNIVARFVHLAVFHLAG